MPREIMGGNSRNRVRYAEKQVSGKLEGAKTPDSSAAPVLMYKGGGHYDILIGGEVVAKAQGLEAAQNAAREAVS